EVPDAGATRLPDRDGGRVHGWRVLVLRCAREQRLRRGRGQAAQRGSQGAVPQGDRGGLEAGEVNIDLRAVVKRFGAVTAVDCTTLTIADGELFTLLGPSGCGKTTLLRMLAGFAAPDEGEIWFGTRRVDGLAPYERNIGMVFQNYALWPHMTVRANVAYGLTLRKLSRDEIARRVETGLGRVNLAGLHHRYPGQLSGGQQQRVALARPLVPNPDIPP